MSNPGRRVGIVYLSYFIVAMAAEGLLSSGHAIAGISIEIVSYLLYGVVSLLLCRLFFDLDLRVAAAAVVVSWIGCAIGVLRLIHVSTGILAPLQFFGIFCLMLGYLVFRSGLLPKTLGVLLALAGAAWLVLSVAHPHAIAAYIQGLGIVAEFALMLWLLVFGTEKITAPAV
ncbi:MAG TPA: DUF4386 family protein [Candidatus Tumulicola sp.]|jgi:hypothetical protein